MAPVAATLVVPGVFARSPLAVAPAVVAFTDGAIADATARHSGALGPVTRFVAAPARSALVDWARARGIGQIVMPYVPVGPAADTLAPLIAAARAANLPLVEVLRPYDAAAWPHATAGFFRFREMIPQLVKELGLASGRAA
jgi:deoxyribodipyrimidine photo-lyase